MHRSTEINAPNQDLGLQPLRNWLPRAVLTTLALASLLLASASARAACGALSTKVAHPASWQAEAGPAAFLLDVDEEKESLHSIVGMWHVTFTAEGNAEGPPNGTPIDNALVVWHSDKTEVMNSGRPAQDGDFCLGVWEATSKDCYKLNHFAWAANDTTNAPSGIGNPTGPTHITEEVTLGPDGYHYYGKFTLESYDTSGNRTARITGVIKATRITMKTSVGDLL